MYKYIQLTSFLHKNMLVPNNRKISRVMILIFVLVFLLHITTTAEKKNQPNNRKNLREMTLLEVIRL